MNITLNGESVSVYNGISLVELLKHYDLNPETVAVEINFEIIPRFKFKETFLNEDDSIEVVHFVGGG